MPPAIFGTNLDLVTTCGEVVTYRGRNTRFNFQRLPLRPYTRRFTGFLQRHAVVDHIDDRLEHCGKNTRTTRSPQGHERADRLAG